MEHVYIPVAPLWHGWTPLAGDDAGRVATGVQLDPQDDRDARALEVCPRRPQFLLAGEIAPQRLDKRHQNRRLLGTQSALHTRGNVPGPASISAGPGVPLPAVTDLERAVISLGFDVAAVTPLAGDASQRRFFRVLGAAGGSVVAALYPAEIAAQAARDHAVQRWGFDRGLPIPRPLGCTEAVTVSEDLGDTDLERALARGVDAVPLALDALAAFGSCRWDGLATPPFDASLFRRELAVFEDFTFGQRRDPASTAFLDSLAQRLADHPYRLVHRDFHVNNLFLHGGKVLAVDFQDMRAGPDTYDLASLLRERSGAQAIDREETWKALAAERLAWDAGWGERYLECAAQRGLKVIGTFLRLASLGRRRYLDWIPPVASRALAALAELSAPVAFGDAIAGAIGRQGL